MKRVRFLQRGSSGLKVIVIIPVAMLVAGIGWFTYANHRLQYWDGKAGELCAKEGEAIQIRIDPNVYRDAETNHVLVSYYTLHAKGGWLIRTLGISETNAPLLFRSGCAPKDQDALKRKFNITVIN